MEQSLNAGTRPKPLFAKMLHALLLVIFLAEVGMMALFLSFLLLTRGDLAAITAGMVAEPEVHALLWFLIVSVGLLLLVIGQRFSSVRVRPWGIPLILFGAISGSVLNLLRVSYQNACCMFAYTLSSGYPFTAIARSVVLPDYEPWSEVYTYIQNYPGQVQWEISWTSLILNVMFYANASLLLVVVLQFVSRRLMGLKRG